MKHLSQNEIALLFILRTLSGANPRKSVSVDTIMGHLAPDVRDYDFVSEIMMELEQGGLVRADSRAPTHYAITLAGLKEILHLFGK